MLHVFVRGLGNGIFVNQFNGTSWTGWAELPGGGSTPSAPAAASYNGQLHVFVRGGDSRIYDNRFNGASWSG